MASKMFRETRVSRNELLDHFSRSLLPFFFVISYILIRSAIPWPDTDDVREKE